MGSPAARPRRSSACTAQPLPDTLTYPRFVLHVLRHSGYSHYIGNMMMILVVGPPLEEKYGSRPLFLGDISHGAGVRLVHWLFFPGTALLGASGIVFMMIVMSSLAGMKDGYIPITLILVLVLYLGGEIVDGVMLKNNISQLSHRRRHLRCFPRNKHEKVSLWKTCLSAPVCWASNAILRRQQRPCLRRR